ncbi:MAG: HypC/HybG/HupF family hydrogenase formation chaperone [Bacillus sp. (in: Bacteria)]|nr:HypC/HybG/HupF family hydrogenase formation chaperone [Bacillus sp. (in: firmicutes)]
MCIGVPGKVVSVNGIAATADVMGTLVEVGTIFIPEVKVGDYIIIHAGQGMSIVDEEYAKLSTEQWRELSNDRL